MCRPKHEVSAILLIFNRTYFEEGFLWDVFHNLVNAAVAMQGGLDKDRKVLGGQCIHLDLKPSNSQPSMSFCFPNR